MRSEEKEENGGRNQDRTRTKTNKTSKLTDGRMDGRKRRVGEWRRKKTLERSREGRKGLNNLSLLASSSPSSTRTHTH